jgi:cytochrome c oxidase cbb3-type subunit I
MAAMFPFYVIRALGGVLYLAGAFLMVFNVWKTIRGDAPAYAPVGVVQPAE